VSEIVKTEALVVHGMRWKDTSKIVHLFTADKGYVKVIAKGALRSKSEFRGVLENLNHIEAIFSIKESRGLQVISHASLISAFGNIRENLDNVAVSFAMLELIRSLIHFNESAQLLFEQTIHILTAMDLAVEKMSPIIFLQQFLIILSEYLGFGWTFDVCGKCETAPTKFPLGVDVANGAIVCPECRPPGSLPFKLNEQEWKLLKDLQTTKAENLKAAKNLRYSQKASQRLTEILLAHLNYHTEQSLQLKSLKMYLS
jgi:DNA repair protein RecO